MNRMSIMQRNDLYLHLQLSKNITLTKTEYFNQQNEHCLWSAITQIQKGGEVFCPRTQLPHVMPVVWINASFKSVGKQLPRLWYLTASLLCLKRKGICTCLCCKVLITSQLGLFTFVWRTICFSQCISNILTSYNQMHSTKILTKH